MDSLLVKPRKVTIWVFQLGHFLAEMDRLLDEEAREKIKMGFNWATS